MSERRTVTMLATALLLLAGSCLRAGTVSVLNPGFETGDLSGWTITDPGQVTASGPTIVTTDNGDLWRVLPHNSFMAQLVGYSYDASSLDTFFGLAPGTIASNVPSASVGDGILQTVTGNAGDTFSMAWAMVATDYPPFNDTAFVVVNQGSTNVLYQNLACVTGGCPSVLGDGGAQPWTIFSYTLPATGTYTFGFGVVNTTDNYADPYLLLDSEPGILRAVPEPSTYLLLGGGLVAVAGWARRRKRT